MRAIGCLVKLTGLEILADFYDLQSDRDRIRRVKGNCPYFVNICEQLPNLKQLTFLRIRGFSSHQDDEGHARSLEDSECLVGQVLPQSLKTLILELPSMRIPYGAVRWLWTEQQTYALENLLIKFAEDIGFKTLSFLGKKIAPPLMPQMRTFRIEYPDEKLISLQRSDEEELRNSLATPFVGNMAGLRSLHLPPFFFADKVPDTLKELGFLFDHGYSKGWRSRDKVLVKALSRLTFPFHLKGITVGVANEDGLCDGPGRDGMARRLPRADVYCGEKDIGIKLVEDLPWEKRMADFLHCGRVA